MSNWLSSRSDNRGLVVIQGMLLCFVLLFFFAIENKCKGAGL